MLGHFGADAIFGRVEQVPGLFFVATRFFHANFIPLIPLRSYLVFAKPKNTRRPATLTATELQGTVAPDRLTRLTGLAGYHVGVPIGLSGKSVCYAWLRFALFVASMIALLWCLVIVVDSLAVQRGLKPTTLLANLVPPLVTGVFVFLTLLTTYRLSEASPRRALELAARVGLPLERVHAYLAERYPHLADEPWDGSERLLEHTEDSSIP